MSIAEYVREVLLTCPYIKAGPFELAIDFLGYKPSRYSISAEPTEQTVKRFLGGGSVRRYSFALCAQYTAIDDEERAANAAHYEDLSLWLEQQTRRRKLPPMTGGASPRSLLATGNVYVEERASDGNALTYRMQMELLYDQKAR